MSNKPPGNNRSDVYVSQAKKPGLCVDFDFVSTLTHNDVAFFYLLGVTEGHAAAEGQPLMDQFTSYRQEPSMHACTAAVGLSGVS